MSLLRKAYKKIDYLVFILNGKKPWTLGYHAYKEEKIKNVLKKEQFDPHKLESGYGFRIDERIIEYPWFLSRLPSGTGKLLDAGSSLNFEYIISHRKLSEKRIFISTLAPEPNCFWRKGVSYVFQDLRNTCFRDDYFDWIVSISTIEHIGLDNTMLYTDDITKRENNPYAYLDVVKEFYRILKPGGKLYVTLPFGKYKNHSWFQVFDSTMLDQSIETFSPTLVIENHFRYESEGWRVSSREESRNATCFDIHQQKTYDADYAAFSRAVVCLEMVK